MAYRIDDDENRYQDLKDKVDQLEIQTFSPEVVARNESTRNTGIQSGSGAVSNPYPMWYPVRDFGDVGLVTQEILLNRVDSQIAKMRIIGDVDFAFSVPPPTNKGMWFILDVTIDGTGGYTINLPGNVTPATTINNSANARTVLRFTTTDGGVTYFAEDLTSGGSGGTSFPLQPPKENLTPAIAATSTIDISIETGNAKQIQFPAGDIGFAITGDPPNTVSQKILVMFIQDGIGGRSLTAVDSRIKNGNLMDASLDKSIDGKTVFELVTLDGGVSYHAELVDLTSGGISNVPNPSSQFQHLQSDGANQWIAQQELEFGADSADAGQIRVPNDSIGLAWRNAANDGNIELKVNASDILDITNSAKDTVTLSLRAQDATFGDISSSWSQLPNVAGVGGSTIVTYPTELAFHHGATLVALFDATDEANFFGDVDVNGNDIIKVDRFQLSGGTTSATSVNDVVWYLSSNGDLVSNINAGDGWLWTSGNISTMILTDSTLEKRNVTAPVFQLYNTRAAQVGNAGTINILANSTDISTGVSMGFIIVDTEVITGDGSGSLKLGVNLNGVATSFIEINDSNDGNVKILSTLDLNSHKIINTLDPTADQDVATKKYVDDNIGGANNEILEGDSFVRITDAGIGFINFQVDNTALGSVTTALGWVLENDVILASGDLTLSSGDFILGNGFEIVNTSSNTTTFAIPADEFLSITQGGEIRILVEDDIILSCDSNRDILFQEEGVEVGKYDGSSNEWNFAQPVRFSGNINGDIFTTGSGALGSASTPWAGGSFNTLNIVTGGVTGGTLIANADGLEINASLSGDFIELKSQGTNRARFAAEADGGITFFEPFEINDEMRIDGGNIIHAHDGVQCGFAVTDEITSPGTEGTMQMPRTSDTTPTAADLDTDFGSALGCYGLATLGGLPATPLFVIKVETSPSTWRGFLMFPSGNVTAIEIT